MREKNVRDMTVGSPAKHILLFAIPLLIGNLFQQLYNMVDSVIVGNYVGDNALAAVGNCSSLYFLFFSLSSGLAIGIGVLVSQFFGAKQYEKVGLTIANAIYVLAAASIIVSILGILLAPSLMTMLHTPPEIMGDAVTYLRTTCAGVIAIAAYNGVSAILRALGDSKTPLYFLVIASVVNVGLDLLLVLYFGMGVFGVALATIVSQAVSAISCIIYAYRKVSFFKLTRVQMRPDHFLIQKAFKLGVPIALQSALIAISCLILQRVVNSYGAIVMAAFTITSRVEQLIQQPYGSVGAALTTYSGQNIGAGNLSRVRKGLMQASIMVLVFTACMIPVFFFCGKYIVGFFVGEADAAVIEMGGNGLKITCLAFFFLSMIYIPRACLNGCGDTGFSMINGIAEVVCRVLFSYGFTRIEGIGYWGIWLTSGVTWCIVSIVCWIRYASGKWKYKGVHNLK